MKKFKVVLEEVLTYTIEVEAENEDEARELAYSDEMYVNSISDDLDSEIISVNEMDN